ncbi:MAG: sulfatase-like hydrolase/transferase, partial [Pirellula sp.]
LTGCYANRIGIHGALGPAAKNGIHDDEVLISELLKSKGYRTCAVGKWHLGHHQKFLPLQHGFDRYLGLPYSNDMWPHGPVVKRGTFPELPLIRDNEIIDQDVDGQDQSKLTKQYSDFASD